MPDDNDIKINQKVNYTLPQEHYVAPQDNTKVVINFKLPPVKQKNADFNKALQKALNIKQEQLKPLKENKPDTSDQLATAVRKAVPEVSDKFISQIEDMAKKLKCDPLDVAALLFKESRFDPSQSHGSFRGIGQMNRNSLKAAIKYIEKHPQEAEGIDPDMTIEEFVKLSREEQMPYVKNYTLAMKNTYLGKDKKITGADLYALFYTPAYAKKDTLTSADSPSADVRKMYRNNRWLDKVDDNNNYRKDGKITKRDLQFTLDSIKTEVFKIPEHIVKSTVHIDHKG